MFSEIQAVPGVSQTTLPQRALGQTGHAVTLFGLGGEGVLRMYDRTRDGSLQLLDKSLQRLRTDHLDLW